MPGFRSLHHNHPGHQSYSLGNLCETYNIDLKDHHRALCDARAAAHLLNLINQHRAARAETGGIAA
jgi:DNA polymerase III subunit epsilon